MKINVILKRGLFAIFLCLSSYVQAQYQITPECYLEIEPNRYIIHFTLPDYTLVNETIEDYEGEDICELFSRIEMEDTVSYDMTDEIGYPELPFFSIDLPLPDCATNVEVGIEHSSIDIDYPQYFIEPAKLGSWINEEGEYVGLNEDCYNTEYYSNGYTNEYPEGFYRNFYSTSEAYSVSGYNGFTLSIHPFSYRPEEGNVIYVLREVTFVVEVGCGNLLSTISDIQSGTSQNAVIAQLYYDNFADSNADINSGTNFGARGKYLILAANRNMEEYLTPYMYHKRSQNYNVGIIYLDEYGALGNRDAIKELIDTNDSLVNSDYVLLVGTLEDIPASKGWNSMDHPYSDEDYHDYIGRWIVSPNPQGYYTDLELIVDKTIQTEADYVARSSTAALFSGKDSKRIISKHFFKHNKRLAKKSFYKMGIPYTLYDGRDYNQNQANNKMVTAINNHTRFLIYNGHGNKFFIGDPYYLYATNIAGLTNTSPCPMGFGFACLLNSYTTNAHFGAKWVANTGGGVTFYGSTVNTGISSDNFLSNKIFKQLKKLTTKIHNFPISWWIEIAETKYYRALSTSTRRKQIEKYNLIGDPTLFIYGLDEDGNAAPFHLTKKDNFNEQSIDSINDLIISMELYDINGQKLSINTNNQVLDELPSGVYIIRIQYNDGTCNIQKIIK